MTNKLKQKKFRFGEIFPHVLNFAVVFATFWYEIPIIVDGFFKKELTVSLPSFVLYIGTMLSLFMSELVYESIEDNYPKVHLILIRSSLSGCLVSFVAIMFGSNIAMWEKFPDIKFWVFHIMRCIVDVSFGILCGACFYKIIALWNEDDEKNEVNFMLNGKLSDFDVDSSNGRKGD